MPSPHVPHASLASGPHTAVPITATSEIKQPLLSARAGAASLSIRADGGQEEFWGQDSWGHSSLPVGLRRVREFSGIKRK